MKLKLFFIFALLCVMSLFGAKKVVVVDKIESKTAKPIATARLGMLEERISDAILNSQKFDLVERKNLDAFLREQGLADSGMAEEEDEEDAEEVGVTVAGYVIYGSVLRCETAMKTVEIDGVAHKHCTATLELLIKIGDCKSTKILMSKKKMSTVRLREAAISSTRNLEEEAIEEASTQVAVSVVNALIELAYPVKIIKIGKKDMTVNLAKEMTNVGAIYEVYELGEEMFDPDTNESLGAEEELLGRVKVTRCSAKTARCVVADGEELTLDDFEKGMILRRVEEEVKIIEPKKAKTKKRSLRDNL